jgi:amino acid adenylation domain-containing protein
MSPLPIHEARHPSSRPAETATPSTRNKFSPGIIPSTFEAQAEAAPSNVAVVCGAETLTYDELNRRANRVARYLRKAGVSKETMVGLYMDRTIDAIVAIAGILKAGGAYVPMDPIYPQDRIDFILGDAGVGVVLTEQRLVANVPKNGRNILVMEEHRTAISQEDDQNLDTELSPENAAYVIYTSGSTGRPKGVVVTHRNVVRLFEATDSFFGFTASDVWTLFHSFTFDLSVWEMWGAFFYGGKLVIVPYMTSRSPQAFHELVAKEGATSLTQTPSAFRQLIWADESASTRLDLQLRYVVLAGEALELQSLRGWFERHGDARPQIVNMYGITETTVHVTHRRITKADLDNCLGSVIGDPMSDLTLHILDECQKPCRVGEVGEIYVGGPGVARGYLNRPDLNQKRFLPNPFSNQSDDRLYRSGDLAKRLEGGEIEFLGRMDDQVKVRGFRVELGEIQSALNRHPGIRESVIIPQSDIGQGVRLIAYVVPRDEQLGVEELRAFLATTLPDYMIPAAFISIEAVPLTLNGKVNRRLLPAPGRTRPNLATPFAAPSTAAEKILTRIWTDVLQLSEVGVHDNFFALGGDSILSIQILARAREEGLELALETLFAHPTISELARAAQQPVARSSSPARQPFSLIHPSDAARMPAEITDAYPMARLQQAMLFHSGLIAGAAIFHDVFSYHVRFAFDEGRFRQSANRLVERHAILRTAFDLAHYTEPLQLVRENANAQVSVENLQSLPASEQQRRLFGWIHTEKRNPFEWSNPPFVRFHVQIQSQQAFQLIVSFHHSVMDGWSLATLVTELLQDYIGSLDGRGRVPEAPKATYRDFIQLELQAVDSAQTREFWKTKLADLPGTTLARWPAQFRNGSHEQARGPEIRLPKDLLQQLKQLAQSLGVPLKTVLLTAHCRVVALLSSQTEVVTGLIANGRPESADGERLVGLFLNAVPLRLSLEDGSWRQLIERTFASERELLPHRRMPFAEIKRIHGGKLVVESAFDYVHFHTLTNIPGFKEGRFSEDAYFEANDFPLYTTFMLNADGSELEMHFDYMASEFSEEQIQRMCDYYVNSLTAMAAQPDAPFQKATLLPRSESDRLLIELNQTAEALPSVCLHTLFEEQVKKTPDRIAARFGEAAMTYEELNCRADLRAQQLHGHEVGPESIVGICLERSLEMLVSVIATLKSGGSYLPLDPQYPAERIAFMADEAQPKVILTERKFLHLFSPSGPRLICLDDLNGLEDGESNRASALASPTPQNRAYLIYTSGSTGKPKGVEITHGSVVNALLSMRARPGIEAEDTLLAVTTLSFDISVLELWLPLISGATVVIASSETMLDMTALAAAIDRYRISVMQATPTLWRTLVGSGWKGEPRLKAICGGEALAPDLAEKLTSLCGELWNMYGPTETTIWSTACKIEGAPDPVSIGVPIANTEIYVLDNELRPVPFCSEGEIYIGGAGLAHGYFKRPELTGERFVTHPFRSGQRLYRTGDLGRVLPDGALVTCGRVDHQVKIHGHRIELGEIEATLQQLPAVSAAAVTISQKPDADRRLVAYWVPRPGQTPTPSSLRRALEEKLPAFMVPSTFVALEKLPLLPNGKLDRKKLPEPQGDLRESDQPYVGPRTPVEILITDTWKEILRLERVGIHDDFFALGGDSLRAAQIMARLRKQLSLQTSFSSIFQNRTVERLALALVRQLAFSGSGLDQSSPSAGDRRGTAHVKSFQEV